MKTSSSITFAALTALALSAAAPARADMTYDISGTFGGAVSGNTPTGLEGGTFSGSFTTADPLPATVPFLVLPSFEVSLYDSGGQLVATIDQAASDATGVFFQQYVGTGLARLALTDSSYGLVLFFSSQFDGDGAVVPSGNGVYSYATGPASNSATQVASGRSTSLGAAVPEPSSLALCCAAAMIGLAPRLARSRAKARLVRVQSAS